MACWPAPAYQGIRRRIAKIVDSRLGEAVESVTWAATTA